MKIAISASGSDLSSSVDPRFGRCPFFLLVDTDTMEFEAVENSNVSAMSGAGIQSAQFIANKGAKALLTGSCGPNAFQTLQAAGVDVIVGVTGTVQEAVQKYKSGQFQPAPQPDVPSHFGMGMGGSQAPGPGFGMGRGMGRGMGPGMGYGAPFQAPGMTPSIPGMPQLSPEEELKNLKQQAEDLRQQTEMITKRIKELEKKK